LNEQKRIKDDSFNKFKETARGQREQAKKELEDLNNQKINKQSEM
jgi:hypothetical protein